MRLYALNGSTHWTKGQWDDTVEQEAAAYFVSRRLAYNIYSNRRRTRETLSLTMCDNKLSQRWRVSFISSISNSLLGIKISKKLNGLTMVTAVRI